MIFREQDKYLFSRTSGGMCAVTVALAVFVILLSITSGLFADELNSTPTVPATSIGLSGVLQFSRQLSRENFTAQRSKSLMAEDTGRLVTILGCFRTADARRDITSVKVAVASLPSGSSEKGSDNYINLAEANTAVLSTESAKAPLDQGASGEIVADLAADAGSTAGAFVSRDDFTGHTREYLQTKK